MVLLDMALWAPVPDDLVPNRAPAGRREALSVPAGPPDEVPLRRLSRAHVAVRANGFLTHRLRDGGLVHDAHAIEVLLDTGSSLAMATTTGQELFGLDVGPDRPVRTRGFSGALGRLYPVSEDQFFHISAYARTDPNRVLVAVRHMTPHRLHDAHIIAPPTLLGPKNGAVRMDFARSRFAVCESVEHCGGRHRWRPTARKPCQPHPELVPVDVQINGRRARMMLDTGGATVVFDRFFEKSGLGTLAREMVDGELIGTGKGGTIARRARGDWQVRIGEGGPEVTTQAIWVTGTKKGVGVSKCFPDGTLGSDVLKKCRIIVSDRSPRSAFVSCD